MAKVIFNAQLSKKEKNIPSGIALTVKGRMDIGVIDNRKVTYENQHLFYVGVKWDDKKRLLMMTEEQMSSNKNIGIFISTYPIELVDGKLFIHEKFNVGVEVSSVCYKRDIGGYEEGSDEVQPVTKGLVAINPKKVDIYLAVGTAKEKFIVKNKAGFYFVCDFKKNNWFTLRPGSSKIELYDYDGNIAAKDILKEKLPFPGLDRKLYDEAVSELEYGNFDIKKHALKYV